MLCCAHGFAGRFMFDEFYVPCGCMQVLPLAFLAKSDEDKDVAGLWGEVWEEGTTGGAAALRLYAADIVPLLTAGAS